MRVVVTGGGPAGSFIALMLARQGVEVTVLEKKRFPRDKACGEFLSPLGVRCLKETGLLQAVTNAGAERIDHASLVLPSGASADSPFPSSNDGTPLYGLSLPRRTFDTLLLDEAREAGAEIRQPFQLQEIEREEDDNKTGWTLRGYEEGVEKTLTCDLLIGADGVGSVVARRLGWLKPSWPQRMGITASFQGLTLPPNVIEMHLLPRMYCGVVAQEGGIAHVGLAFDYCKGDWPAGRSPEDVMMERLGRFPGINDRLKTAALASPVTAFGPMAVRATRRVGDGVMLVGDAAGFLDPVTGHGMGFALRSAVLAAETIREAVRNGCASHVTLHPYEDRYSAAFGGMLHDYRIMQRLLAAPPPVFGMMGRILEACPALSRKLIHAALMDRSAQGRNLLPSSAPNSPMERKSHTEAG